MLMCTARDFIKTEMLDEYKKLIFELVEKTREEDGNISYTLYEDSLNAGEFVLIEFWKTKEALELHFKTAHFTSIVPQIQKLQMKASDVKTYTELY